MIANDAELTVVREQRAHVEAALDSIRRDVKPKNEKMYHLMAESYIDMLQTLQSDIDAYLGINVKEGDKIASLAMVAPEEAVEEEAVEETPAQP
jgi:hypothetical protein